MVEGFNSFKENAVNGGAKWIDFTLNVKIRGGIENSYLQFMKMQAI